jgi:hypothetical protein
MLNNQSYVFPAKRSTRLRPGATTSAPFPRAHSATESLAVTTHVIWCPRSSKSVPHWTSSEPSPIRRQLSFAVAGEAIILNILRDAPRKPRATNLGGLDQVAARKRAMVGVQADEMITIVNVLYGTCLAAARRCFKRPIRRQSRR